MSVTQGDTLLTIEFFGLVVAYMVLFEKYLVGYVRNVAQWAFGR